MAPAWRLLPLQGAVHRAGAGVAAARQQAAAWIRRAARHRDVSSRSKQSPCLSAALQAGLLLALFGGVRKAPGEEGEMALRGDVHILMVGACYCSSFWLLLFCRRQPAAAGMAFLYKIGRSLGCRLAASFQQPQ